MPCRTPSDPPRKTPPRTALYGAPQLGREAPGPLTYADATVAGYEARGPFGTWESYRARVDTVRRYASGRGFEPRPPFEAVTPAFG